MFQASDDYLGASVPRGIERVSDTEGPRWANNIVPQGMSYC